MEEAEEKGNEEISKSNSDFVRKIKKNPWIISTIALGLIVIVLLVVNFTGITGNVISEDKAVENTIGIIKQAYGVSLEYVSAQEEDGLYSINCLLNGNPLVIKTTKDFSFILLPGDRWVRVADLQESIDSTQQNQEPEEVPKSDNPIVDMYIMSFCPYGNQAEDTMLPVYNLLKSKVDFNIHFIVSVSGDSVQSLHGQPEVDEDEREACVLKEYGKDKLWSFMNAINDNCGSKGDCWETQSQKLGIDANKIKSCVASNGLSLMKAEAEASDNAGASGSPTLIINGVKSTAVYKYGDSETYKSAICSAFNTAPSECSQKLGTTTSASTGGSC